MSKSKSFFMSLFSNREGRSARKAYRRMAKERGRLRAFNLGKKIKIF